MNLQATPNVCVDKRYPHQGETYATTGICFASDVAARSTGALQCISQQSDETYAWCVNKRTSAVMTCADNQGAKVPTLCQGTPRTQVVELGL